MEKLGSDVKCLTEDLLQKQWTDYGEVIEKLFSEVSALEFAKIPNLQLAECAVQLWNWAVTKNLGDSLSKIQQAKVRHVACSLLYCCEPENPTEGAIRKQILMASKTGRTWLECKNPQMADNFLRLAVKSLETLYSQLMTRGDAADSSSSKADVEKDLLRILSCQAESALAQGKNQEAVAYIQRCKDMLQRLPKDTAYLSLICYNFGLETYNLRKMEDSAFWLSQSYDIGKMNVKYGPGKDVLAKALRLLATVYLEWDCQKFQEKSLDAVNFANKECASTSGLYLKIRILLRCGAPDDHIRAGVNEMLESQVPLDVCLSIVKLLMAEDREQLSFEFLKRVCQHFDSSPDLGNALVLHIELLLQKGKELLAKQKIEDIITGHHTGKQLAPQALTSLHVMLWDQGSKHFEAGQHSDALQWYNYSLSFFKSGQMEPNLARLQRNRASCFLQLQQLEKAKEAVKESERCDPGSIFTQFSVYKIAVLESNSEKAAEAVNAMGLLCKSSVPSKDRLLVSEISVSYLLSLAAQMALENGQEETAMKALDVLCKNSDDPAQVLTGLRCLVRLKIAADKSTEEMRDVNLDVLLPYLKLALQTVSHQPKTTAEQFTEETNWFRKIAWNSALQCESCPDKMRDFFVLSYQFSLLCPPDRTLLMGQRTCLLMAVSTSLELFRKSPQYAQAEELTLALEYILTCWEVWKTLKSSGNVAQDPTESLLLLYEFETRAKLNDPKVETILDSVLELENVETKMLETMAALAMEPPAYFPQLCKKALRVALSLHKKQPQVDLTNCSKCVHSLIKLSLPSGVSEVEAHVLQEVWDYFEEALSIISAAPDDFPEMETLWLLTQAWNTGILLYSLAQYLEAEKWCGLSMSFIRHLGALQKSYEKQMSGLYSEILDKLDKAKRNLMDN
ncbi:testis-expressed sequence 11 protein [Austrofundulus limnaeus]|uniref:Protein ZIP4 homolog n=1 Tax=Austrofundulus limnaeus TaxID=52670 RepID=A0A2I4D7V9_AUSLI|nr:PREDICTED: testis-expressed sequence 11 protein [Austrofundulus limnaeus]